MHDASITMSGAVGLGNEVRTLTINTEVTLSRLVGGTVGGLTKVCNGALTLSGANTYSSNATVSADSPIICAARLVAGSNVLNVVSGATLESGVAAIKSDNRHCQSEGCVSSPSRPVCLVTSWLLKLVRKRAGYCCG